MPITQPPVPRLSAGIDLRGQTAIVTGASSGLGVEFTRQLLAFGAAHVVMAVRNVAKGESVKKRLLADEAISKPNPNAEVTVMVVDFESFSSVKRFAALVKERLSRLDVVMLNAGVSELKRQLTEDGYEKNVQVNYFSNVVLLFELLPLLEATSTQSGRPSRVSVTGSRMHTMSHLIAKTESSPGPNVLAYLNTPEGYRSLVRYGDSKLLVVLFLYELGKRYHPDKVIINQFCPGMVDTDLTDALPFYFRIPVLLVKKLRARRVEEGGWVGMNAVCVAGKESHGQLLGDMEIFEPIAFVKSEAGQKLQAKVWQETISELKDVVEFRIF